MRGREIVLHGKEAAYMYGESCGDERFELALCVVGFQINTPHVLWGHDDVSATSGISQLSSIDICKIIYSLLKKHANTSNI